jgi:YggT family protein
MRSLYSLVDFVFWLLGLAILLRVLFSWIHPDPGNVIVRVVFQVTEPILAPLRRFVPTLSGLDLSPMVALMLLELVRRLVMTILFG